MATSRVPLRLYGERQHPVPPLDLPDEAPEASLAEISGSEAARLFLDRAQAVQPAFALSAENAPLVAEICRRLDGLPLAIELAAARVYMFPPRDLLVRMEQPLALLTGGPRDAPARQQTLRDTIAWSYGLLDDGEQQLFRVLSVARGGWTLAAAEGFAGDDSDVVERLSALVEHGLARQIETDGTTRFGMLETVREFGWERLAVLGELDEARDRHARFYLRWAEQRGPDIYRDDMTRAMYAFRSDLDNLRAAFDWVLAQDEPDSVLLESAVTANSWLWAFWRGIGLMGEGRRWMELALAKPNLSDEGREFALNGAGFLAAEQGDFGQATAYHEECMAISLDSGNVDAQLGALWGLGRVSMWQADYERTVEIHEQGLALARELQIRDDIAGFLGNLALVVALLGDVPRGKQILHEALAIRHKFSGALDPIVLMDLALVAVMERNPAEARRCIGDALAMERQRGSSRIIANGLETCAALAVVERQPARAARLYGAAETLRHAVGAPLKPFDLDLYYGPYLEAARGRISEQAWNTAWTEGQAMKLDAAIDYALIFDDDLASPSVSAPALLSKRETEVLQLITAGRSNRQIAAELFISARTVERHIENLYRKLDVHSRAEAIELGRRHLG
jgi:non-specific serine/threonine protein kinase